LRSIAAKLVGPLCFAAGLHIPVRSIEVQLFGVDINVSQ